MKLADFLKVYGAADLDGLDLRALEDLHAFLRQRVARRREDAAETRRPGLRREASAMAAMADEVKAHIDRRKAAAKA